VEKCSTGKEELIKRKLVEVLNSERVGVGGERGKDRGKGEVQRRGVGGEGGQVEQG